MLAVRDRVSVENKTGVLSAGRRVEGGRGAKVGGIYRGEWRMERTHKVDMIK